jgi:hypothetical protein
MEPMEDRRMDLSVITGHIIPTNPELTEVGTDQLTLSDPLNDPLTQGHEVGFLPSLPLCLSGSPLILGILGSSVLRNWHPLY